MLITGGPEQPGGHERAKHHEVVGNAELGQTDSERRGKDSENREERLCCKKPAKKRPHMFVGELVEEEQEGKNDGARDGPIDVVPKHPRLMEDGAEG